MVVSGELELVPGATEFLSGELGLVPGECPLMLDEPEKKNDQKSQPSAIIKMTITEILSQSGFDRLLFGPGGDFGFWGFGEVGIR